MEKINKIKRFNRREFIVTGSSMLLLPILTSAMSQNATINSIIDLYHGSNVSAKEAKDAGVVAIIHKGTQGSGFRDRKYHIRKNEAKNLGLLWGSFHFADNSDVSRQVNNYLNFVKPDNADVVCLDFEHHEGKEMSLNQAEEFVTQFNDQTGRFPMLYGGAWMRQQVGKRTNETLSQCPLWYRRYASLPKEIPTQIWPKYTLWQYTDGKFEADDRHPRSVNGLACDRSMFEGTEEDLRREWPFTRKIA